MGIELGFLFKDKAKGVSTEMGRIKAGRIDLVICTTLPNWCHGQTSFTFSLRKLPSFSFLSDEYLA